MAEQVSTATWLASAHHGVPKNQVMIGVATMTTIDICLDLRSILPYFCQFSISGPNFGCACNQWVSRADERANANAATSKNGVVGKSGKTTPMAPTTTDSNPATSHNQRIPFSKIASCLYPTVMDLCRVY